MPSTIVLKGGFIRKEGEASSAITPGHLIQFGGVNDLEVHQTVGGAARRAFALENDLIGKGIDDAYAAGDSVEYGVFHQGAEVYALVTGAVSLGDALESHGDGTLHPSSTALPESVVAWALETVSVTGRCKVEVA